MDGMQWLASALHATRTRLDVATGNLANVGSDGFQKTYARTVAKPNGVAVAIATDRAQGALVRTGERFDLALVGPGAFSVRDSHGNLEQIRSGRFMRDARGYLSDERGRVVLDDRARAIHLMPSAAVDPDGTIREGPAVIARLALPRGTTIHAGFLEKPNVDAITEMVEVLDAQRSFETAQKVLMTLDDARSKSNDTGRLK